MSWRELISGIYAGVKGAPNIASKPAFYPAASPQDIADLEVQLEAKIPPSLRSLLLESNGVMQMLAIYDGQWFEDMWLLWTVREIIEQNRPFRAARAKG